jgi:hypothetical protein
MDITQYADQRGILLRHADDDLGLKRSIFKSTDDIRLKLGRGAALGANRPRIGNRYVPFLVNSLVWNGNEVASTNSGVRGEQSAGGRFEDRHADNVTNAKPISLWRRLIGKCPHPRTDANLVRKAVMGIMTVAVIITPINVVTCHGLNVGLV